MVIILEYLYPVQIISGTSDNLLNEHLLLWEMNLADFTFLRKMSHHAWVKGKLFPGERKAYKVQVILGHLSPKIPPTP